MFEKLSNFYHSQDPIIFYSFVMSIIISFISFSYFSLNYSQLPSKLPLYYSLPWGASQLVPLPQFVLIPSMIIVIALINLILTWQLKPDQLPLKRTLAFSTMVIALLLLITGIKIIGIYIL